MSGAVNDLWGKLYFVAVPFALVVGITLALWLALFNDAERKSRKIPLPFFDYQIPDTESVHKVTPLDVPQETTARGIFHVDTISSKPEQVLDLHEVALGLVIVSGEKRFCLTNGVLYKEGEGGSGFIVRKIESNGVWYQFGNKDTFLQTGEKVNIDGEGKVRE